MQCVRLDQIEHCVQCSIVCVLCLLYLPDSMPVFAKCVQLQYFMFFCVQDSVPVFTICIARSVLCIFERERVSVFAKYVACSVLCICKIVCIVRVHCFVYL